MGEVGAVVRDCIHGGKNRIQPILKEQAHFNQHIGTFTGENGVPEPNPDCDNLHIPAGPGQAAPRDSWKPSYPGPVQTGDKNQ